jgi:hypothetical protein
MQEIGIGRFLPCGRQTVTNLAFGNGLLAVGAAGNEDADPFVASCFHCGQGGDSDVFALMWHRTGDEHHLAMTAEAIAALGRNKACCAGRKANGFVVVTAWSCLWGSFFCLS